MIETSNITQDFPTDGDIQKRILFLLEFAMRAPSTHNTQPWKFSIDREICKIFSDSEMVLSEGDPNGMYQLISIGALIESLIIAANFFGMNTNVKYINKEDGQVAEVTFEEYKSHKPSLEDKDLFEALVKRFNPRGRFTGDPIDDSIIQNTLNIAHNVNSNIVCTAITNKKLIKHVADKTAVGVKRAHSNSKFRKEMSIWMKNSFSSCREGIHGYTLGIPSIISIFVPILIKFINMGHLLSKKSFEAVVSSSVIMLFGSKIDTSNHIIDVGRSAQRAMLSFHAHEYTTSIFVGAIESGELNIPREIHNAPVNFIFVVGKLEKPIKDWRYSPRHTVYAKIKAIK